MQHFARAELLRLAAARSDAVEGKERPRRGRPWASVSIDLLARFFELTLVCLHMVRKDFAIERVWYSEHMNFQSFFAKFFGVVDDLNSDAG
jgi:hypothetical protein